MVQEELGKNKKFLQQKYFMGANKPGKLKVLLIKKKRRAKMYITGVRVNNSIINDHRGIKDGFVKYFSIFYKANPVQQKEIQQYFFKKKSILSQFQKH